MTALKYAIALFILGCGVEPASAFCDEPDVPSCVEGYGAFDDQYDFDRCKGEMETYRDEVNDFVSCLQDDVDRARREAEDAVRQAQSLAASQADDATSDYSDAVDSFNGRANY